VISWRICSINFFCIFFIFFLSAIFIIIFHFLRSDDNSSLRHYFLIVTSSLVMFIHDVILNEKHVLSYVCSCLLSSCMNVFSFCIFFAMNAFWFSLFFSSESFLKHCISFTATSFHKWSLLFSFFNIDVCIKRLIMLATYFSLLRKLFDLTLLFLYNKSTSFAIIFESALLQFMQFIIIYSSFRFVLSCLYYSFQKFVLHALWLFLFLKKYHDKIIKEHKEWIRDVEISFQNIFWHFESNEKKVLYYMIYLKSESKKLWFNYKETMSAAQQMWFDFIDFFLNLIENSMNWDIDMTQQYTNASQRSNQMI